MNGGSGFALLTSCWQPSSISHLYGWEAEAAVKTNQVPVGGSN